MTGRRDAGEECDGQPAIVLVVAGHALGSSTLEIASIDEAKALLYGHSVDTFVVGRDALVKEIRAGGDRELANEVKALRKPSAVAAEVNQIVRADPDGVDLILQAAALLRSAQAGALDGTAINASELQEQYRAAIRGLAQSATSRKVEVRAALEAATIDESSNDDLRAGCLVVVPTPVSIFGTAPPSVADADEPTKAEAPASEQVDELEERRARRRATKAAEKPVATRQAAAEKAVAEKAVVDKKRAADKAAAEKAAAEKAAADKKRAADKAAVEKAAADKKAAAEAERQRKQAEKERKKKRKDAQKRHRDAVRAHLAALDAEEAASVVIEVAEKDLLETATQIEAAEEALAALRLRHEEATAAQEHNEQARTDAERQAEEAQATVDALAEALEALDE